MDTTNFWNKLYLYRKKIIVISILGFFIIPTALFAQRIKEVNLPNYDEKWIRYGFVLGAHGSTLSLKLNETFTSPAMDSVHSILSPNNFGFTIGFIVNLRLAEYLDFRILPAITFYEHKLIFNYTDQTPVQEPNLESWLVEFPLLFKYKSQRRMNNRMYLVGGINPSVDLTSRKDQEDDTFLSLKKGNLAAEFGFGIDIYYPLFKFSPEIRFSKGLINVMKQGNSPYNLDIDRMTINSVSLFLQFE